MFGPSVTGIFLNGPQRIVYCCEVLLDGGEHLLIASHPKDAAGKVIDFSDLYAAFVREIHAQLQTARNKVEFRSGLGWPEFLRWFLFQGMGWFQVQSYVIPVAILLPEGRGAFSRNLPRRYSPDRIPPGLLPSG